MNVMNLVWEWQIAHKLSLPVDAQGKLVQCKEACSAILFISFFTCYAGWIFSIFFSLCHVVKHIIVVDCHNFAY